MSGSESEGESSSSSNQNENLSIIQPLSYSSSTCGYCHSTPRRSSHSYGCWAHTLSLRSYKTLLDQGWRRSGKYLYKPDMDRTCCPAFTIKLEVEEFKPTKAMRQGVAKFGKMLRGDGDGVEEMEGIGKGQRDKGKGKGKAKGKNSEPKGLMELFEEWEEKEGDDHKFEYVLERASFSTEKYELYKKYQIQVHNDPESKVTPKGFRRFLVDTPLHIETTSDPSCSYGSFHGKYLLDSKLIAFAVIDILPSTTSSSSSSSAGCISSVYFVWDPDFAKYSLGKLSALKEITICLDWEKRTKRKMDYYMGFYIHSCPKMIYKGQYQPSFLLDPATNVYYPWSHVLPILTQSRTSLCPSFSNPAPPPRPSTTTTSNSPSSNSPTEQEEAGPSDNESDSEADDLIFPTPPPLGCLNPLSLPKALLVESFVLESNTLVPLLFSNAYRKKEKKRIVLECIAAMGEKMKGRVVFWVDD